MTILGMKRRFEELNTDKIIEETMIESQDTLADLNAEQINTGLKADGTEMPDYSIRSVIQYGKPAGPIKLRDKGNWQAGLYARVEGEKLVFSSSDVKDAQLVDRYGKEIEGLSEKYKAEAVRDKIKPVLKQKMSEATGLTMK